MAKRILNKRNCTFTCPMLTGMITISQPNNKFNDGTGTALTVQAALTGNGICSVLTASANGVPTKCTLMRASNWSAGMEMQKRINNISLLNEDAMMICPVGGVICVQKPLAPIVPAGFGGAAMGAKTSAAAEQQPKPQNTEPQEESAENDAAPEQGMQVEQSLCAYGSCDKAASCPYMQAASTVTTAGAAARLRSNSKEKERAYNESADRKMEEHRISWNNQAHHLISIKAAYCQYPELVKLGNYFGYDINCKENCYFLPCWESGDGFGQKTSHFKKAQAYEVMKVSGLQWHVGQHSYCIDLHENILQKYPQLRFMDCYNDKLNKDVKKILAACQQRFDGVCLQQNYEAHRQWFIQQMNRLSEQIEEALDLFLGYPKESFPYFVSLEALKFAYEIPRSGKVITIHRTKTQWVVKRYQYTNYLKDESVQLHLLETKELADAEHHRDETVRKLILFCENVTCFLVIDEEMTFQLPFRYKARCQYISKEERAKVESHFSAMLAEQADSGEDAYIAPKTMAVQRLKECGLY